jgi:glycosyltransferase involved in cell wall biosynthesis
MDGAVGVSQKSLEEMIAHYGFRKPSVCIPRAIDVDHFALFKPEGNARIKYGVPNDTFVLLFLGNFTQQKRPDRFLDIIAGIKMVIPQVHGLMVGDGPLRKSVEVQAIKLGIQDQISFVGYQRDVRPWIAMSDVLLLTSDTEGMPGVVLEAGAMSIITISNVVGGIRELIEDGVNGYVILGGDVSLFIKRVLEVYEYPNKKRSFEKINFNKISQSNSIDKIFESYINYFKKSIST